MEIQKAKILVVDDDKVMMMYVVSLLTRLGVQHVQQAEGGNEGLKLVSSFRPDVVLTDIHMAEMNGLEFVAKLRSHPELQLRKTPVLVMSADSSAQTLNDAVPMGVIGYIIKPPQVEVLKIKLQQALKFR
jgi:CheY-like chemotaxis protein